MSMKSLPVVDDSSVREVLARVRSAVRRLERLPSGTPLPRSRDGLRFGTCMRGLHGHFDLRAMRLRRKDRDESQEARHDQDCS